MKRLLAAAVHLAAITFSQAQTVVYDSLDTTPTAGYSQSNSRHPIYGDSLTLAAGGTLNTFGMSLYNSTSSSNTGAIQTGTMLVNFYDNAVPYTGGTINNPLLGSVTLNLDFTGSGGLPAGYYATENFDLSSLNLTLPQNILVTQQFTETSGTSTQNGVVLFSNSSVGSSPNTVYVKSSSTSAGLYTFSGNAGQFGYLIEVTLSGGNHPPVAIAQNISLPENTSVAITLTASDIDGDPLTYSVVNAPTNGTLTGTAPNVVYQPAVNFTGADSFAFIANDGFTNSAPAVVNLTVLPPSAGLVINALYDSTITSDPNAATITNTINSAIAIYEARFATPITVTILFEEMTSGLGQSLTYIGTTSYSSFFSALTARATTTNDVIALAHLTGGTTDPVDGLTSIQLTTANLRALGFNANPPSGQPDSTISLNTSLMNLSRTNINPSLYDLQAVASHEIDEVLGTSSGLGGGSISAVDLFRYDSSGNRNYTTNGDNAHFSIDGGVTDLARYNQNAGADYGDWWSIGAHTPQVQDAYGTPGATPDLGVEFTVLDVVGYDYVPATIPPLFQTVSQTNGTISFTWNSVSGRTYQVESTTNLIPAVWNNLGSPLTAGGTALGVSDSTVTNAQNFYRVALLAPGTPPAAAPSSQSQAIAATLVLGTNRFLPLAP